MNRTRAATRSLLLASALLAPFAITHCSSSRAAPPGGSDAGSMEAGSPSGDENDSATTGTDAGAPSDSAGSDTGIVSDGSTSGDALAAITPPSPAADAGFDTIVFEDDFTTTDTIAPSQSSSSGYKWYWSWSISATSGATQPWSVDTTATAASTANGNDGGGGNASPLGGILTVTGPGDPNDALITVPGWALNNASATLPAEGQGCWSHAYFEAYIQFRIDGNSSADASTGWPAFWSWSAQGLKGFGFGSSSLTVANYSEIDFMETYGTIFGNQPGNWTATMHQWPANNATDGHTQHTDDDWHTYGCLWTSTGTGTGQVTFYLDGVQVDDTVSTGTGQTQFSLESMFQFIVLGSGQGWSMNVDWVRVWQ
jgi:hypothetical protein